MEKKKDLLINIQELEKINKVIAQHSPVPQKTKIIAVTKTRPIEAIKIATEKNLLIIGENKVQEAEKKLEDYEHIKEKIEIHLIGHLQSNKVKKAVSFFDVIQTVDSIKILNKINMQAEKIKKQQKVYLQINIGEDNNKYGFSPAGALMACSKIKEYKNIFLKGIMTILPQGKSKIENKKMFIQTLKLQKKIQRKHEPLCSETSMGMSGDYTEAIKSGATHIRIGSALFGKRQ